MKEDLFLSYLQTVFQHPALLMTCLASKHTSETIGTGCAHQAPASTTSRAPGGNLTYHARAWGSLRMSYASFSSLNFSAAASARSRFLSASQCTGQSIVHINMYTMQRPHCRFALRTRVPCQSSFSVRSFYVFRAGVKTHAKHFIVTSHCIDQWGRSLPRSLTAR